MRLAERIAGVVLLGFLLLGTGCLAVHTADGTSVWRCSPADFTGKGLHYRGGPTTAPTIIGADEITSKIDPELVRAIFEAGVKAGMAAVKP